MVVSKKKRGDINENKYKEFLEKKGYVVCKSPRTMKRIWTPRGMIFISQANDMFGLYDGIAVKKGELPIYYQVKSNPTHCYESMPKIKLFHDEYLQHCVNSEVVLHVSRKGWCIWKYNNSIMEWNKVFYNNKGIECPAFVITESVK